MQSSKVEPFYYRTYNEQTIYQILNEAWDSKSCNTKNTISLDSQNFTKIPPIQSHTIYHHV
jgi:hypothetical protein